jgi:hypothetical protein
MNHIKIYAVLGTDIVIRCEGQTSREGERERERERATERETCVVQLVPLPCLVGVCIECVHACPHANIVYFNGLIG